MNAKKNFFKYVSLSMLSMLGMSCYILADTLFIANGIGLDGLTALNLDLPIYNIIFGIGLLLGVGGATLFSISQARNENQKSSVYFTLAIKLGFIVSIPLTLIGFFGADQIVSLLGANSEIQGMAALYLRSFIAFTPFFIFQQIVVCFIRNDHNPRLASLAMLLGTLFNIVFDYILIYPCQMGMMGAALATGCSPIVTLLICSYHLISKQNHFHFIKTSYHLKSIIKIIQIGISAFITELSSGVIIFAFNSVVLNIGGNIAVASYGIISNLAIVVTSLFTGIAQGIQPLISHCYGAKEIKQIKEYMKLAVISSLILGTVVWFCTLLFPENIISLFNSENNQTMIAIAKIGLPLYFLGYFFVGINMVFISYFASTSQVKPSSLLSILRGGVIVIPLMLILSQFFLLNGVWISYPISELLIMILGIIFFQKSLNEKI